MAAVTFTLSGKSGNINGIFMIDMLSRITTHTITPKTFTNGEIMRMIGMVTTDCYAGWVDYRHNNAAAAGEQWEKILYSKVFFDDLSFQVYIDATTPKY